VKKVATTTCGTGVGVGGLEEVELLPQPANARKRTRRESAAAGFIRW